MTRLPSQDGREDSTPRAEELDTASPPTAAEGAVRRPRAEPDRALTRGTLVGRYVVLDRIGAGGMGVVYAAYDPELNRRVALKLMQPRAGDAADGQSRLLREAQALARLSHPNVVAVFDVGSVGDRVFLAMELVEGVTLGAWLRAAKHSWREIVAVFAAAGRGLGAAHAAGIVHRDFKPGNVLVGNDARARVLDFGLARAAGEQVEQDDPISSSARDVLHEDLTQTGSVMGTPVYMPPEARRGEAVGQSGDQFSFCVALYEALYGKRPFDATAAAGELTVQPPPADSRVPPWLFRVVARGLAARDDARFSSMDALLAALADDPAVRRRKFVIATVGALVLGGLVAGGVVWRAQVRAERLAADPCEREAPLGDVWSEATRARVQLAFHAAGGVDVDAVFARTAAALDERTRGWLAARDSACADTRERHAQPEAVLLARLACLDQLKDVTAALIEIFARADAGVVQGATESASRLATPAVCENPRSLTIVEPPPAAIRGPVDDVNRRLMSVRALSALPNPNAMAKQLRAMISEARALGYGPLLADSLLELCSEDDALPPAELRAHCDEAERVAIASRMDGDAARVAALRFDIGVSTGQDTELVRRWAEQARAWIDRDGDLRAEYWLEEGLGIGAADSAEALGHFRRNEQLAARIWGPTSSYVLSSRYQVAFALGQLGRYDEAIPLQERLIPDLERVHSAQSTATLANLLQDYGGNLFYVGRFAGARVALERVLALPGARDMAVAVAECELAKVDVAEGVPEAAVKHAEHGMMKLRAMSAPPVAAASEQVTVAIAYLAAKRYGDALTATKRCLSELRAVRQPDGYERVPCLLVEGTALVEVGRAHEATDDLEHALELQGGTVWEPGFVARVKFQLARALVADRGDRARATTLATQARDELVRYDFLRAQLAELDAWRATALP